MNERILELAIQAREYAESKPDIYSTAYDKKFSELIVQEMCSVLDKAQWDKGEDWVCADGTRIIPQMKQHFGVE
jgi:hypothetical protein